MNLRDTYLQLERESRDYADADRALATLRRRRTVRQSAGAAGLAAAGLVVATLLLQTGGNGGEIAASPTLSVATTPGYAALPVSGPVGQGAAVYTPCRATCPTLLSLTDGREFALGPHTVTPSGNMTLSPDGRWLGLPTLAGYQLRDLLGDTVVQVPAIGTGGAFSPWVWSADSRRLILGYHQSGDVSGYLQVDLSTGKQTTLTPSAGYEPVGILPSGALVLLDESQYGDAERKRVTLRVDRTDITLTASPAGVFADADHGLSVQVSGGRIFVLEYTDEQKVAVAEFDTTGNRVQYTVLPDGDYAMGPTRDGYATVRMPGDQENGRQQVRVGDQVIGEYPGMAEIALPGSARH
ncbi:hypothetical protein [Acrocarpospora catenulata]|uniref:hypothetical protein n=1 Tax=Acrocarpospora catenulata TaxID=2836182 RepID=UPI001BD9D0F5|nr:hypothetical protein [Acrocarpospora catenulata]